MATKLYDLSQLFGVGAAMWPRYAAEMPCGAPNAFGGVRSTSWHNLNHPGWPDMAWPFPFNQGAAQIPWGHLHGGTHIDAPIYCVADGLTADKIPLENLYGAGVVLDFRKKKKWEAITAADLEKATPKIQRGDFVVINTGWDKRAKTNYEYFNNYIGLVPEAAEWLVKKRVKAIAGTWPTPDHSLCVVPLQQNMPWLYNDYVRETGKPPDKKLFPDGWEVCLTKLLKAGISCISSAGGEIDDVTGERCTLCAWPYRLEDTDAAHVRLVHEHNGVPGEPGQLSFLPGRLKPEQPGGGIGQGIVIDDGAAAFVGDGQAPAYRPHYLPLDRRRPDGHAKEAVQPGGIIRGDGIAADVIFKVSRVKLLQRLAHILRAVDIDMLILQYDAGETLAVLDIHVLHEGTRGQLRPSRHILQVARHLGARRLRVGLRHTADYRRETAKFYLSHLV